MTEQPQDQTLPDEELELAEGAPLPDREAMSTLPIADPIGGFTLPVDPTD